MFLEKYDIILAMKFRVLLFMFLPLVAFARPLVVPTLPESGFADTESVTNIPFDVSAEYWGKLDICLSVNATASNNVQIVFGVDANENGVLEPMETEVVLGWDAGAWFLRDERADWSRQWPMTSGSRVLSYGLRIVSQKPRRVEVSDDDAPLFAATKPEIPLTLFNPSWNCLRVTSRGRALRDELIALKLTRFGILLEIR